MLTECDWDRVAAQKNQMKFGKIRVLFCVLVRPEKQLLFLEKAAFVFENNLRRQMHATKEEEREAGKEKWEGKWWLARKTVHLKTTRGTCMLRNLFFDVAVVISVVLFHRVAFVCALLVVAVLLWKWEDSEEQSTRGFTAHWVHQPSHPHTHTQYATNSTKRTTTNSKNKACRTPQRLNQTLTIGCWTSRHSKRNAAVVFHLCTTESYVCRFTLLQLLALLLRFASKTPLSGGKALHFFGLFICLFVGEGEAPCLPLIFIPAFIALYTYPVTQPSQTRHKINKKIERN